MNFKPVVNQRTEHNDRINIRLNILMAQLFSILIFLEFKTGLCYVYSTINSIICRRVPACLRYTLRRLAGKEDIQEETGHEGYPVSLGCLL